jgi:hypothetical protein
MKGVLAELVSGAPSSVQAVNEVREYLQARILGILQRRGAMVPLAFQGGTALRFLFSTMRYSEDLDFALENHASDYDLRDYLNAMESEFLAEDYEFNVKINASKTVNTVSLRFLGLLYELGLSQHSRQVFTIKLEVDTNPPAGAVLDTTVVRRHALLRLQHHNRASLFAGKLHAVLQRPFLKGRDVYDLIWYLSDPDWPAPNLVLLNNALRQTGWKGRALTEGSWRGAVRAKLDDVIWDRVLDDVMPFLGPGANPEILTRENLLSLL